MFCKVMFIRTCWEESSFKKGSARELLYTIPEVLCQLYASLLTTSPDQEAWRADAGYSLSRLAEHCSSSKFVHRNGRYGTLMVYFGVHRAMTRSIGSVSTAAARLELIEKSSAIKARNSCIFEAVTRVALTPCGALSWCQRRGVACVDEGAKRRRESTLNQLQALVQMLEQSDYHLYRIEYGSLSRRDHGHQVLR